ncbi:hypothetical protein GSI_15663 [Ganoderma sinense ZZ0214-1]|uniref:Uncharacterized protein n=1 Tax=Ganoderma sinense ZZ0214-1 TaxID=1077348 RepID=A0A2G8RN77_9APHY|nr:hypothetical protein GSI_15663 [Ganoderma sinense ZZ0214-1]
MDGARAKPQYRETFFIFAQTKRPLQTARETQNEQERAKTSTRGSREARRARSAKFEPEAPSPLPLGRDDTRAPTAAGPVPFLQLPLHARVLALAILVLVLDRSCLRILPLPFAFASRRVLRQTPAIAVVQNRRTWRR